MSFRGILRQTVVGKRYSITQTIFINGNQEISLSRQHDQTDWRLQHKYSAIREVKFHLGF